MPRLPRPPLPEATNLFFRIYVEPRAPSRGFFLDVCIYAHYGENRVFSLYSHAAAASPERITRNTPFVVVPRSNTADPKSLERRMFVFLYRRFFVYVCARSVMTAETPNVVRRAKRFPKTYTSIISVFLFLFLFFVFSGTFLLRCYGNEKSDTPSDGAESPPPRIYVNGLYLVCVIGFRCVLYITFYSPVSSSTTVVKEAGAPYVYSEKEAHHSSKAARDDFFNPSFAPETYQDTRYLFVLPETPWYHSSKRWCLPQNAIFPKRRNSRSAGRRTARPSRGTPKRKKKERLEALRAARSTDVRMIPYGGGTILNRTRLKNTKKLPGIYISLFFLTIFGPTIAGGHS